LVDPAPAPASDVSVTYDNFLVLETNQIPELRCEQALAPNRPWNRVGVKGAYKSLPPMFPVVSVSTNVHTDSSKSCVLLHFLPSNPTKGLAGKQVVLEFDFCTNTETLV